MEFVSVDVLTSPILDASITKGVSYHGGNMYPALVGFCLLFLFVDAESG